MVFYSLWDFGYYVTQKRTIHSRRVGVQVKYSVVAVASAEKVCVLCACVCGLQPSVMYLIVITISNFAN